MMMNIGILTCMESFCTHKHVQLRPAIAWGFHVGAQNSRLDHCINEVKA